MCRSVCVGVCVCVCVFYDHDKPSTCRKTTKLDSKTIFKLVSNPAIKVSTVTYPGTVINNIYVYTYVAVIHVS